MLEQFDYQLRAALTDIEQQEGFCGLIQAIASYRRSAAGLQDTYEYEMWEFVQPERLGGDYLGAWDKLLTSLATDLKTVRYVIAFETDKLLDTFETALHSRSFKQ